MARHIALFEGLDVSAGLGLWVTNGTAAGTSEIGGIDNSGVSGANAGGVMPADPGFPDLTVFGAEALFEGEDKSFHFGLWETNGTAVGTHELTGISGAASNGIAPVNLTVLGSEVLFAGSDTANETGLWVTNGTAGGTSELTGISGADPDGLGPVDLTVFDREVLFEAPDPVHSFDLGLWVTDGTANSTREVGGAAAANRRPR